MTGERPAMAGDGLYVPRVTPDTLGATPQFEGMSIIAGPGQTADTINVIVAAQQTGGLGLVLLDHDYRPASPNLAYLVLQHGSLDGRNGELGKVYDAKWPPPAAHEIPVQQFDGTTLPALTTVPLPALGSFFVKEKRRYDDNRYVKERGIAAYGMGLLYREKESGPFSLYHDGGVIIAATKIGELATAIVGIRGASRYLLSPGGRRLHRQPYQGFTVSDGIIYGNNPDQRKRRATTIGSGRIPKQELRGIRPHGAWDLL